MFSSANLFQQSTRACLSAELFNRQISRYTTLIDSAVGLACMSASVPYALLSVCPCVSVSDPSANARLCVRAYVRRLSVFQLGWKSIFFVISVRMSQLFLCLLSEGKFPCLSLRLFSSA